MERFDKPWYERKYEKSVKIGPDEWDIPCFRSEKYCSKACKRRAYRIRKENKRQKAVMERLIFYHKHGWYLSLIHI